MFYHVIFVFSKELGPSRVISALTYEYSRLFTSNESNLCGTLIVQNIRTTQLSANKSHVLLPSYNYMVWQMYLVFSHVIFVNMMQISYLGLTMVCCLQDNVVFDANASTNGFYIRYTVSMLFISYILSCVEYIFSHSLM